MQAAWAGLCLVRIRYAEPAFMLNFYLLPELRVI